MIVKTLSLLIVLLQSTVILGITYSCDTQKVQKGSDTTCTCISSNNIVWEQNDIALSTCTTTNVCSPKPAGYIFQNDVSQTDKNYGLTVQSFDYSSCADYSCTDTVTLEEKKIEISVAEFDVNSVVASEPGANTDGSINVTTGCVFPPEDISVKWYKVQNGNEEEITVNIPNSIFNRATCTGTCNSKENEILTNGLTHTEYTNTDSVKVKYKVVVRHSSFPDPGDEFTWTTSSEYLLKADCTCECKCKCKNMVFASIAIGIAGAITLLIVVGGTVKERIGRKTALVVDSIGILCGVTSFVLGIVVQAIDCCEDCCEDSDCCECERNWVENTGAAFIAIGALVGIAGGVIFYRVWFGRMGPGNNGGNGFFCFNNGNDDGNDGGNDGGNNGHHRGRGTNSSTVHTERADTNRGTLSDRTNSDGEVSRKDVHVQENRDNFSGRRPMPPIPLTDNKGRGLSANYDDDDHPMISVGIPEKKKGDLGPLEEEPKKKKKKKKKAVNDDDDV